MNEEVQKQPSLKEKILHKFDFLKDIHSLFYYVLLLIAIGFGFFGYALITQKFTTPYSGDFSQQAYQLYYNFYDDWWTFFKTGRFPFYDANTFIGADNIASNTYYGLFSPFTFPILFVSRDFIPHMMALISIARLVVGGLFFRIYVKYLGASEKSARIFSIAYAFVGWMAYYLWFNPFYEVLTFFPLILFGIEKVIKEKKMWAVILGFFLLSISNYFFLLSIGIFSVCYAVFRYFQTIKTRNLKDNLLVILYGFLGFAFGIGLSMFAVFPALLSGFSINRASTSNYFEVLKESLVNKDFGRFFKIFFTCWKSNITDETNFTLNYYSFCFPLASYFYPPVSDRFTNIMHYNSFENTGSSIFIYTPCMILMGCSIFRSIKNKKISHLLAMLVLVMCLFIPFFYFLCGAFVTAYGRWEIVVAIAALAYIALNFDHLDEIPKFVVIVSGMICLYGMIGTYFLAKYVIKTYDNFSEIGDMIFVVLYEVILCVIETGLMAGFWKKKYLSTIIKGSLATEIIVVGSLVANIHGLQNINTSVGGGYNNIPIETEIMAEINANDDSFFRVQSSRAYDGNTNIGMIENFNGVSTFHSFYNNEVDDFQRFSQIMAGDTGWSGQAAWKRTNLDEFLGVKYYISKDSDTTFTYTVNGSSNKVTFNPNIPLGYERIDNDEDNDGYRVYKNKYQINLGTSFNTLYYKHNCSMTYYNSFYPSTSSLSYVIRNEEAYFKGAILNDEDIYEIVEDYPDIFTLAEASSIVRNAKITPITVKGVYVNENEKYFDPLDPDRDIIDDNKVDMDNFDYENPSVPINRMQIVLEPSSDSYFPLGEEGTYFMFNYPVRSSYSNYNATVYLIGEDDSGNGKVITFDNGRNCKRNSARSWRGLYSSEKVKRIIVCVDGDRFIANEGSLQLYYEKFEDCIARYQEAINNELHDVEYNVNEFKFTTNYETTRFVVTQLAYTGGWRAFATDENGNKTQLKVYNAQGGFVGFVAPKGNISYTLNYIPKNFTTGTIITFASLIGIAITTGVSVAIVRFRKKDD